MSCTSSAHRRKETEEHTNSSCLSLFFGCASSIPSIQLPFVSEFRGEEIWVKHGTVLCTQTLLEMRNLVSLALQIKRIFLHTLLVRTVKDERDAGILTAPSLRLALASSRILSNSFRRSSAFFKPDFGVLPPA